MSGHNDPDLAVDPGVPGQPSRLSRRSVLRGAAGAGAVGLAAATGAGAIVAAARTGAKAAAPTARPAAVPANAEPVVVYLRDARTGDLEVFSGTSGVRFRDPALAARLLRAVQ